MSWQFQMAMLVPFLDLLQALRALAQTTAGVTPQPGLRKVLAPHLSRLREGHDHWPLVDK